MIRIVKAPFIVLLAATMLWGCSQINDVIDKDTAARARASVGLNVVERILQKFNSEQWKAEKSSRYEMSADWSATYKKVGMSPEAVQEQLGPPDGKNERGHDEYFIYEMSNPNDGIQKKLTIQFQNGKLTDALFED